LFFWRSFDLLFKALAVIYNLVLITALLLPGLQGSVSAATWVVAGLAIPPALYFILWLVKRNGFFSAVRGVFFWLALLTTTVLFAFNLIGALASAEYLLLLPILPLPLYFWISLIGRFVRRSPAAEDRREKEEPAPEMRKEAAEVEEEEKEEAPSTAKAVLDRVEELEETESIDDSTRRDFLKKIGGAGIGLLVYSLLNPRDAGAAFFGSVPGGGTVGLRDTTNTQIDPAVKGLQSQTTSYGIIEIDDGDPAYYGFVNKDGGWYILKEDETTGDFAYRYASPVNNPTETDFDDAWTDRGTTLTYGYFDVAF